MVFTDFCRLGQLRFAMGGAGLVFDNLSINLVAITSNSALQRSLSEQEQREIEVGCIPVPRRTSARGEGGVYAMLEHVLESFQSRYLQTPRVLAVGPAARWTDCGGIVSAPVVDGKTSHIDTWAGRGGLGSKLLQQHGIAAVIYGGTHVEEDFKDRNVADGWFQQRYEQKLLAKDFEATRKYRFDPAFDTGGTFGVNYSGNAGSLLAFNYRSIYWTEAERAAFHATHIRDHYLRQFNSETIASKKFSTCGEPCGGARNTTASSRRTTNLSGSGPAHRGLRSARRGIHLPPRGYSGLRCHLRRNAGLMMDCLRADSRLQTFGVEDIPRWERTVSPLWRIPSTTPALPSNCWITASGQTAPST